MSITCSRAQRLVYCEAAWGLVRFRFQSIQKVYTLALKYLNSVWAHGPLGLTVLGLG